MLANECDGVKEALWVLTVNVGKWCTEIALHHLGKRSFGAALHSGQDGGDGCGVF